MNTANIKSYAPKARRDFIQAVTEKAHLLGLSENQIEPVEIKGDVAIIAGRPYPKGVGTIRKALENRIRRDGFELTMRKMAYTWFNRFVAIRYMELHDYLDHGFRVMSNRAGSEVPEILEHATDVDLPGLNKEEVVRLRLAGDKDNELYQLLIVAQCNALSRAMPFLFEKIGGYDELLMPDNLLHSNSSVRNMVNEIPEEDWQQIEIIGWIYQFYIAEKKDEVIGKVVKTEDIPAATQLFTPNWIVKYMVQNSLGAQWLATYPNSPLKGQMDYYIEPAEQTDEVKAQLETITPSTLNPEEITLIDPASGSGHILAEAYELFKAIYLERGYRQRDVAQLILEKNLFGLDIDGRAAQLTGFALMMKGRSDDRRLFERGVKLNVMALVDSTGFYSEGVDLADYGLQLGDLAELKRLFEHATTFGSLIQIPKGLAAKLPALEQLSEATSQDLFVSDALKRLGPLVQQVKMLAAQYDAVVANPPYMGGKFHCSILKCFVRDCFPDTKSDLFACFIERGYTLAKKHGHNAMVTMQSWMFLSSLQKMRERLLREKTICTMAHLGAGAFGSISGEVVQASAFILKNRPIEGFRPAFFRLLDGGENEKQTALIKHEKRCDTISQDKFEKIPGCPLAYWVSDNLRRVFEKGTPLGNLVDAKEGLGTRDDARFLRLWPEVSQARIGFCCVDRGTAENSKKRWFPCNKGGSFRKWSGNQEHIVNWEGDGKEIKSFRDGNGILKSRPQNQSYYFRPSLSWSSISSGSNAFRKYDAGSINNDQSMSAFATGKLDVGAVAAFCNTSIAQIIAHLINPTLKFGIGDFVKIPFDEEIDHQVIAHVSQSAARLVMISSNDWNAYERSWEFQSPPILAAQSETAATLESSYSNWISHNRGTIVETKRLEEENNRLFIDAYDLAEELTPDVPIEQITLTVNPAYRYGGNLTEEELWTRFRQDTMAELVSYAIGCMMGRYSLDVLGLIYANSGNEGFDPSRYTTFPADDDGILPLTDTEWFDDDTTNRLVKFISIAWDAVHLEKNLTFLADNLSPKKNESSRDTIRRYLCDSFFKDHLQTYKKRPIYWLLSSGKQKAFQCLIYLHRYNESTLSRVRSAYVTPLFGYFNARLEYLQNEWDAADSASAKKKFQKEIDDMKKKLAELSTLDDELRHYADKRISLDLDDGVKVNYGKFGNLLAEKKAVTGEK